MSISLIKMTNFRNHTQTEMAFGPGVNVIWGENGSGKTSILEAIHLLSVGKSFKTNTTKETIKDQKETTRIKGVFKTKNNKEQIITFGQTKSLKTKIKINDVLVKRKELLGKNPTVLLSPEEQGITTGSPGERRRYFDKLYSTVSSEYLNDLLIYTKTLKQRNSLLKTQPTEETINPWNIKLAEKAEKVWKTRYRFNNNFLQGLVNVSKAYNQTGVIVALKKEDIQTQKEDLLLVFKKTLTKDIQTQRTTVGPHRDSLSFSLNNKPIKIYGSQGEHKIALVLIKLAEYTFIKNETGETPTLLLDDLFAKLDFARSDAVLALLEKKTQTIITNTDLVDIKKHGINLEDTNNKNFHLMRAC